MSGIFIETEGEDAVIAHLHPRDPSAILEMPIAGSNAVGHAHAGATVQVLERNSMGSWLKVIHVDGNKKSHMGWIPVTAVESITHRQAPYEIHDLKIASVAHGESDDVAAQIATERSKLWRSLLPFSWLWIGFWIMIGVGITAMMVANRNVGMDFGASAVVLGVLTGIVIGGFTYVVAQSIADRPIHDRIRRLSNIER